MEDATNPTNQTSPDTTQVITPAPGTGLTDCILKAKQGIIGDCFKNIVPVTPADAKYTSYDGVKIQYVVDPTIPYPTQLEFSTFEQAQALQSLIEFYYPGSNLTIDDYAGNFSFYPFRRLVYLNDGGLLAPRLYRITGTINLDGDTPTPTQFSVGWVINVKRILQGGLNPWTQQAGYPDGNSKLVTVNEMGLAQPEWTGGDKK